MFGRSTIRAAAITGIFLVARVSLVAGTPATGDCDGDCDVDLVDFARFQLCFTGPGGTVGKMCECADFDSDSDVDLVDFSDFQLAFTGAVGATQSIELAGHSLNGYPHFEFVQAFNEGSGIELAVDPTLHPTIIGAVCDVYVVEARSSLEWSADSLLVDARASGSHTETFSSVSSVQGNRFPLVDAALLSGDGGTDVGHGYDLVLDCNQNGRLDSCDWIDGAGDETGLFVVNDITDSGPLVVTSSDYSFGTFLSQRTFYPVGLAAMSPPPLVVISHGNGHQYTWYDYLQSHLASYGYVVMSHSNNTGPGIEAASTTTLTNTDRFLLEDPIPGDVDSSRIVWIGHSRGGEGVVRAYDRIHDGEFVPGQFGLEDLLLVSSIAPNDYLGRHLSDPHSVNYHLLVGAADGDNGGWPDRESDAPLHLLERAQGNRHHTYVHGADHNVFNCCGFMDFVGPAGTFIGRPEAQRVTKADYLTLIEHYAEENIPGAEYHWRPYGRLRPIGVEETTVVDFEYHKGPAETFVIDDYQTQPSMAISSSGGVVLATVEAMFEGQYDDTDGTFTWNPIDPTNGFTRGRVDDLTKGTVFGWSAGTNRFLEYSIVEDGRDMSGGGFLSFRACQQTRHPLTVAETGDLTFTLSLIDGSGTSSSINIDAYGAGIQEPYQRVGSGVGAGWQCEFETVRVRLTDFLADGSGLELSDIRMVRFDFGNEFGSDQGRIGLDDIEVTLN